MCFTPTTKATYSTAFYAAPSEWTLIAELWYKQYAVFTTPCGIFYKFKSTFSPQYLLYSKFSFWNNLLRCHGSFKICLFKSLTICWQQIPFFKHSTKPLNSNSIQRITRLWLTNLKLFCYEFCWLNWASHQRIRISILNNQWQIQTERYFLAVFVECKVVEDHL